MCSKPPPNYRVEGAPEVVVIHKGYKQEYKAEVECEYCGSIHSDDRCTSCGAPRTN
jgi:hypothetical protein